MRVGQPVLGAREDTWKEGERWAPSLAALAWHRAMGPPVPACAFGGELVIGSISPGSRGRVMGHQSLICLDRTQEPHLQQPSAWSELVVKENSLRFWRMRLEEKAQVHREGQVEMSPVIHLQDAPFSSRRTCGQRGRRSGHKDAGAFIVSGKRTQGLGFFCCGEGKKGLSVLNLLWGDRTPSLTSFSHLP